jgi:hypothetical protein
MRKRLQMLGFSQKCMGQNWPRHWLRQKDETKPTILMKFCYQCGRATAGNPLFCSKCGRSYDVKLCPRLHRNSRYAKVCSQCGSRELSQPQAAVSFWWKLLEFLAQVVFGVLLVYVSLAGLIALLRTREVQAGLVVFGILLGILWWLWSLLPEWFRKLVIRSIKRKEQNHER